MPERIRLRWAAPPDSFFTAEAAEGLVGQKAMQAVGWRDEGLPPATVVEAFIVDGGRAIEAVLEAERFPDMTKGGPTALGVSNLETDPRVEMLAPELLPEEE